MQPSVKPAMRASRFSSAAMALQPFESSYVAITRDMLASSAQDHAPTEPTVVADNPWAVLHNSVTPAYKLKLIAAQEVEEQYSERARFAYGVPCPGVERGFSPTQLLSAIAMVVAGRHQGGLPRTGEHRRPVRPRGAQSQPRNEAAERGLTQDLREARHPAGLHPLQRVPARSVLLSVLRHARRPDLRSSAAALARRAHDLG